jgi:two-component system sensor histidine kinase AlgZ
LTEARRAASEDSPDQDFFLPDFCDARAVLAVALIAALLACVLALARQSLHGAFWMDLARTSAYLLWTGLLCAALLCRLRSWLARRPLRESSAYALAVIVVTVVLFSEIVYWFGAAWAGRLGEHSAMFPRSHAAFVLPNAAIAAIVGALLLRYFYVAHQWRRSVEFESRERIRALQARIRPHFLFNSMNTIAALTRSDPTRAEEAVEDLSDLFRFTLNETRTQITLREELEVARIYQRMEQLRLGERLKVRWQVGELPAEARVPSLLLQPLLENAIYHGIEPLADGGTVEVRGRTFDDRIEIEVANPVGGEGARRRQGNGIALDNIRQRLELAYPGRASVAVEADDQRHSVRLCIPWLQAEASSRAVP